MTQRRSGKELPGDGDLVSQYCHQRRCVLKQRPARQVHPAVISGAERWWCNHALMQDLDPKLSLKNEAMGAGETGMRKGLKCSAKSSLTWS